MVAGRKTQVRNKGVELLFYCVFLICYSLSSLADPGGSEAVIVQNDSGGDLADRIRMIEHFQDRGTKVEIRSGYCYSACTLFLGLKNTCVASDVRFGFHGPSAASYGISLPPSQFEYWSLIMARHYPPDIREWFLKQSRYTLVGFEFILGRELISQGIKECETRAKFAAHDG